MVMDIQFERDHRIGAQIKVIGIGGAGSNAVDDLINSKLADVEFYVMNTDVQALERSICPNKIQIGRELTGGRGAGSNPEIGRQAAEDAIDEIRKILEGADMVFITAGLGGGTGTGAAPVVARLASEMNILTVAVVVFPFEFEGKVRARNAEKGLEELKACVDACTVVHNQRLLSLSDQKMTVKEAFRMANDVLTSAVRSVAEVISESGEFNVEFSDIRTIMQRKGGAVISFGVGKGDRRAVEAVEKAKDNKLLRELDMKGATGVLIYFKGGNDLTIHEVADACELIRREAAEDANIILGMKFDESLKDEVRVTIIATGIGQDLEPKSELSSSFSATSLPGSSSSAYRSQPAAPVMTSPDPAPRAATTPQPSSGSASTPPKAVDASPSAKSTKEDTPVYSMSKEFQFVDDARTTASPSPAPEPSTRPASPHVSSPDDKSAPALYRRRTGL